jgi:hypothetical protein
MTESLAMHLRIPQCGLPSLRADLFIKFFLSNAQILPQDALHFFHVSTGALMSVGPFELFTFWPKIKYVRHRISFLMDNWFTPSQFPASDDECQKLLYRCALCYWFHALFRRPAGRITTPAFMAWKDESWNSNKITNLPEKAGIFV